MLWGSVWEEKEKKKGKGDRGGGDVMKISRVGMFKDLRSWYSERSFESVGEERGGLWDGSRERRRCMTNCQLTDVKQVQYKYKGPFQKIS